MNIIEIVKTFLESKGYRVITAEIGEAGFELFKKHSISLVLLDLMLPGISGEEVYENPATIKNSDYYANGKSH